MISLDRLRLEVEDEALGPVNLIKNGSGEVGTAGWTTPVSGSTLVSSTTSGGTQDHGIAGQKLVYTTASGANRLNSEPVALSAGQWAAARWVVPYVDGGYYYRARFEFLDSNETVLASGNPTGYRQASTAEAFLRPTQAPAGAVKARVRFDYYSNATGSNPSAGKDLILRGLQVAKGAAQADLGSVRTNLFASPSHEVDLAGWQSSSGMYRDSRQAYTGIWSLLYVLPGYSTDLVSKSMPVTPGQRYGVALMVRAFSAPNDLSSGRLRALYYNASGFPVGSVIEGTPQADSASEWRRRTIDAGVAPAGAASLVIYVDWPSTVAGARKFIDAVIVAPGEADPFYFDGSTATTTGQGSKTVHGWLGAPNTSTSEAVTLLDFQTAATFSDVLAESHEIKIVREPLDLGTLTAVVLDPDLDPATASALRPGRAARVQVDPVGDGTYVPLIVTETDTLRVTYAPRTRINLAGADAVKQLANAPRAEGVASIAELPSVLEGLNVPWSVNGSTAQAGTYTTVSVNDNAKAVDQIAIVRDLSYGFAWVDRSGQIVVNDQVHMATSTVRTFAEDDYSDLSVGFDTSAVVNSVTVKYLTYVNGETSETFYGPYEDAASIAEWGFRSATYTLHMASESAAAIAAFASAVLAANAQPERRITDLAIPIRTDADLVKTLVDLCDLVQVDHAATGISETYRVASIQHEIQADPQRGARWVMRLGVSDPNFLPLPQVIPSP